jgi:hypothetical protein
MVLPKFTLNVGKEFDKVTSYLRIFFLLAAEELNKILSQGIGLGHFERLVPPVINSGKKIDFAICRRCSSIH